ncbi:hypothetical protein [Streptomyces niveus]|uniref:hypothetical protein n=2 Tax=Streptomyces niveus TaxID=193462 RepID=UPI000A63B2E0|nr:hypothetical protein [Streptomyces niveus]
MSNSRTRMKREANAENEVHDVAEFTDAARNVVTPVLQLPEDIALAVVNAFTKVVRDAKRSESATTRNKDGITRFQTFEEGDVYMLEAPFDDFFADRYLMDFYNVEERGVCSRMHMHTGLRFVRMMTGPDTRIRVSSLSPFEISGVTGVTPFSLRSFEDALPDTPPGVERTRYNLVVPPCSFVDMQIPRGVSHQFNAVGEHAVIDSVHPEESVETFREKMSGFKMMAQTVFLADELPASDTCADLPT